MGWGAGGKGGDSAGGKGKGGWTPVWQPQWKGGWDKGWGKGSGKRKADPEKTVWIGGLPENEASNERNKAVQEHLKQAGDCKYVRIGKTGTGAAGFSSAEEAQTAIAMLNGSTFQGSVIEVDVWTKKEA